MRTICLMLLLAVPAAAQDLLAVVNKTDSTLSVLERDSGKVLGTVPTGKIPHEVAVTPDGKLAFTSDYNPRGEPPGHTVTAIDLVTLKQAFTIDLGVNNKPHGLAVSADGKWLWVTCEGSHTVLKIDLGKRTIAATVDTKEAPTHLIALDEAHHRAFATSIDAGILVVIDTRTAKVVKNVPCGAGAEGIDATPDGRLVLVSNGSAGTLTVLDAKSLEPLKTFDVGKGPYRVRALPDSKRALVTTIKQGDLAEIDLQKLEVTRRLELGKEPVGVICSADGKRAWAASTGSDVIHVVDLEQWKVLGTLTAGKEPDGMAFVKRAKK